MMNTFLYEPFDIQNKNQIDTFYHIWKDPETRQAFPGFDEVLLPFEMQLSTMKMKQNITRKDYFIRYQNTYIGWINITSFQELRTTVELAYAFHPNYRNLHLGTLIVKQFLEELKKDAIQQVGAYVAFENKKSQKILFYNQFLSSKVEEGILYFHKQLR